MNKIISLPTKNFVKPLLARPFAYRIYKHIQKNKLEAVADQQTIFKKITTMKEIQTIKNLSTQVQTPNGVKSDLKDAYKMGLSVSVIAILITILYMIKIKDYSECLKNSETDNQ